jgi:hypothetical protein
MKECKEKMESCTDVKDSQEWCETMDAVTNNENCIWLYGNTNGDKNAKCIDEVFCFSFFLFE